MIAEVLGRPSFLPAPGFALGAVFGEMSTVLLDGQRAIPQKLLDLGFQFRYETARAALRDLLGKSETTNSPSSAAQVGKADAGPADAKSETKAPAIAGKE